MLLLPPAARAAPEDDILAARDAYTARNATRLAQAAQRLEGHPLAALARYWQLALELDKASASDVRAFFAAYPDSFLADRLRGEWLKLLGARQDWALFSAEYPLLVTEDRTITCYALQARLALLPGDLSPLNEAKRLWFTGAPLPASCEPLFERLAQEARLTVDDVFARLRLALEAGNVSVARHITRYLPERYQPGLKALESIADNPQRFLDRGGFTLADRSKREMVMFAVQRIARSDPQQGAARWERLEERFSPEERAYCWGQIATQGARRHDPSSLAWFARAQGSPLTDAQLAWEVRAALRAGQWQTVLTAIEAMSAEEARQAGWRYWKARALKALGKPVAANEILVPLSREHSYYGQLALEELGIVMAPPATNYKASEEEIRAIATRPGIERALAFYRAGLRSEGTREWQWNIRGMDDRQLLAAAELARRNDLIDRAIAAAERTEKLYDFELRFPTPHRDVMQSYTRKLGLDDAWVYGLIRQESRFVQVAKSAVGASGLMQLMPATAKWVAKRLGLDRFHLGLVNELETNLSLGTYYLRHVYDRLDGSPVLATAAYNAGPGRARRWQAVRPLEGAVYVESIPFNETRDYVKKVMSNAAYYAARLGERLTSLRERLGVVPGKGDRTEADFAKEP
ncbi:transglycosylase SLT domain-containing protein [Thiobacter aerophilum]|uniref:Transglycosylase SLT domain-containing protein n=1 Tax=Thiobacter aerophilum TaxID=3121275 RepID=A0ABV0EF67_9BURK